MRTRNLLVAGTAALLTLGVALPASAAPGETALSVQLTGGSLSITVPADAGSLGSRPNTVLGGTISGSLGAVQVDDARAGTLGWVASVISTALTPPAGATIGAAQLSYSVGTITQVGTATYTSTPAATLTGVMPVVTATGVNLDNSATWNPTITVNISGGKAAGVYTGTITHSVV
jgi:hypothetical protein